MSKLVIFDLDGTIIDSVQDIMDSVNVTLKQFGYPERSLDEIKQFIGNGARNLIKKSLGGMETEEKIDECLAYYNEHYTNSGSPKTKVFDGLEDVFINLKSKGYKLAILTNKPQMTTDDVYKNYLSKFEFDCVVGQRTGNKIKPNPEMVFAIMKEVGAEKEDVYFVGDGDTDVQVALNASINGISALWGYRTKSQLEQVGAKTFAKTPSELINIIR